MSAGNEAVVRRFYEEMNNDRKLELAEEFQRIGDKDGARDLLREVLATASGATKTKAQGMLDRSLTWCEIKGGVQSAAG